MSRLLLPHDGHPRGGGGLPGRRGTDGDGWRETPRAGNVLRPYPVSQKRPDEEPGRFLLAGRWGVAQYGHKWGHMEGERSMPYVSVRELKGQLSRILREVRQEQREYPITYQGRVVACLTPVVSPSQPVEEERIEKALRSLGRLAEEIERRWPEHVSATNAVREQRREL